MKLNITTLAGAGAIAAAFLLGGVAVESVPVAVAQPVKQQPTEDPYKTCRSGGGTVKDCCAKVGGTYTETEVTAPNPTGPGQIVVGVKKSCSYSVAGRPAVDTTQATKDWRVQVLPARLAAS